MSSKHPTILQGFSSYFTLFHSYHNLEGTVFFFKQGNERTEGDMANRWRSKDHSQSLQQTKLRGPVLCCGMNHPASCLGALCPHVSVQVTIWSDL